jgi:hypothetical protein
MPDGYYLIPSTIRIRARVTKAGTRDPEDASVTLAALNVGGQSVAVTDRNFTKISDGEYVFLLATAALAPGTYKYVVRASNGTDAVTVVEDAFVLKATSISVP